MKQRILFLNYDYPPLGGGSGNAMKNILLELSKNNNVIVDALASSSNNKYEKIRLSKNVTLRLIPIGKKKKKLQKQSILNIIKFIINSYFVTRKLTDKYKYDINHTFFAFPTGITSFLLKKKVPYSIYLRGSDVPYHNPAYKYQYYFLTPFIKKVCKNAKYIIANSVDLKKTAEKHIKKNILIIPNGIDISFYKPIKKSIKNKTKKLLFVGRFHKVKGIEFLINAVLKLQKDIELILVGDGPLQKEYKKKYRNEKIIFKGQLNKSSLLKEYQNSDIFILPSFNEGMSNTLLEAMACGLAILTTDTGGAKTLIKGNGDIIEKGSSKSIKAKINLLLDSNLDNLKIKSRKISEKYSWNIVTSKILSLK